MTESVLDASALIALVRKESGWENVLAYLPGALISAVNLSETIHRLRRYQMPLEEIQATLSQLVPRTIPFDEPQAYVAASIHEKTRAFGLSFGDCACLALALSRHLPAITAEREWPKVDVGVKICLIR